MSIASFYAADGTPLGSQVIPDGQTVMLGLPGSAQPVAAIQITPVVRQPEPAPEIPEPAGFRELVLAWLREKGDHPEAASVEKVSGWGTDWDGDTEGGFYDSFGVSIDWTDSDGGKHFTEPHGDAMESLWHWVVRAWPETSA
jgi:hypothetical protein